MLRLFYEQNSLFTYPLREIENFKAYDSLKSSDTTFIVQIQSWQFLICHLRVHNTWRVLLRFLLSSFSRGNKLFAYSGNFLYDKKSIDII